jgi:zinc transporter ZupT
MTSENLQKTPIIDLKQRIFRELFEETRPSISNKDQLLMKEQTNLFNRKNLTSFLLLLALSIHAFFEGLALGLIDANREVFYILIAISFHKWVEALSIVTY